jgi:hypothetical protein
MTQNESIRLYINKYHHNDRDIERYGHLNTWRQAMFPDDTFGTRGFESTRLHRILRHIKETLE